MSILVIGITGSLGEFFAQAAKIHGIELHALVRPATRADPKNAARFDGVIVHEGTIDDREALLKACTGRQAIVSLLGSHQILDQLPLIEVAKQAGVKRIIPSEFSCSLNAPASVNMVGYKEKTAVRRAIADAGLEFTTIQSNGFMQWFAAGCFNMLRPAWPKSVEVFDDGNSKIGMTDLRDVAQVALLAALDPRAANKSLLISFSGTLLSQNEMVQLWEELSNTKVERVPRSQEFVQQRIEELRDDPDWVDRVHYLVALGYVFHRLANCQAIEGEVRADEQFYPQIKHITLRNFFEEIIAKGRPEH